MSAPARDTLHVFAVSTRRGHALVVALAVIAIIVLVAAGVTLFAGAPPAIEAWQWEMTIAGVLLLAAALVAHHLRRRELAIVRAGDRYHLVIERERIRLEFPLAVSGDQLTTTTVHGIPLYEVWLKLVDPERGTGIFLAETRGAIYGPEANWLTGIDRSVACERFEVGGAGTLSRMLAAVDECNARVRLRS